MQIERINNKSMLIGTTSTIVSDTQYNAKRTVMYIVNTSTAGQSISITVGLDAAVGIGVTIGPGGFYQDSMSDGYMPSNEQINAISSAAGGTISVQERIIMPGV